VTFQRLRCRACRTSHRKPNELFTCSKVLTPRTSTLYDYKPELVKRRGEELPASVHKGQRLTTMTAGQKSRPLLPGITGWKRYGPSDMMLCNFLPRTPVPSPTGRSSSNP
jgi:hypothetical protein